MLAERNPIPEPGQSYSHIGLARVAELIGVELAAINRCLIENGEIDFRIAKHLNQLVAGYHRPAKPIRLIRSAKTLASGRPVDVTS